MLKNISPLISPELLRILAEMGHGDTIVFGDANFPAESSGADYVVRADGIPIPPLLEAVLALFPIDTFVKQPIGLMQVVPGDDYVPEVVEEYKAILQKNGVAPDQIQYYERFGFYEEASKAYCVVATGETARYANIILKKGVIG